MWIYNYSAEQSDELYHHGVLGMKWGVHRDKTGYRSTGLRASIARKQNEKVDKGFKKWKENSSKKADAVALGKQANKAKMDYEHDRSNKELKSTYKKANKDYKKALKSNTTYRKGAIKNEIGQDISRKYLSDAKKVKKQLDSDPNNKKLKKQYNDLMSKHDVERAKARRAPIVAANRSRKIASMKRTMTMTAKGAAVTAAVGLGTYGVNRYLKKHDVTLNGKSVHIKSEDVQKFKKAVDIGKEFMKYV